MMTLRILPLVLCAFIFHSPEVASQASCDSARVRTHLNWLTAQVPGGSRDYTNHPGLDATAAYILNEFSRHTDSVQVQRFVVNGKTYANIIASFGTEHQERLIVGAHYDACGKQPGADDNASGTIALLELARMLHASSLRHRIDLVAYTLEEPPFFRSQHMGSYYHARYLREKEIPVIGMLCVEMIGYFSHEKRSQDYPSGIMKLAYGSVGNYIAVVQKTGNGSFGRRFNRIFRRNCRIPVRSVKAPAWVPGIDFSDHLNYWTEGYSAVMITDTSFYRNPNYHLPTDTADTLNIPIMCKVIDQICHTITQSFN